jgi:predicted nuclease of predicted toxin-antitoxin system
VNVRLYLDVHVHRAVTDGLRLRKVDVLTAQDDEAADLDDPELLDRATELGRILFSQDDDLLREAKQRQQIGELFSGVIYAHQLNISIVVNVFLIWN